MTSERLLSTSSVCALVSNQPLSAPIGSQQGYRRTMVHLTMRFACLLLLSTARAAALHTIHRPARLAGLKSPVPDSNSEIHRHEVHIVRSVRHDASHHIDRRSALKSLILPPIYTTLTPAASYAIDDMNVLADLPPLAPDQFRIYLCRHGETENNRLRLIQGARVDPPLNDTGMQQAKRLGQALGLASVLPTDMVHSPLLRARQTASIAASQFESQPRMSQLASLSEVDFGSVLEGEPVDQYRADMVATYAAWSIGKLDTRMDDNGESGYQVSCWCW
jgi:Histidine phosphatase superfamily (branch 1)